MSASESNKSKGKSSKSSAGAASKVDATSPTMDPQAQLREIQQLLFGQQISEVRDTIESLKTHNDHQFSELNSLINKSIESLKTDFHSQLDDLTSYVNKLNDASQNRSSLIEDDLATFHQDVDSFEKQTIAAQDALERQLFAEAEKLASDMESKYKSVLGELSNASGDLSDRKTDRAMLAALFTNMANSLEGESS